MLYDDCVGYGSPISRIDRLHLPHCSSSLSQSQRPSQKRDNSRQSPLRHWPSKARHLGVSPFGPGREANEAVVSGWHGGMVAWPGPRLTYSSVRRICRPCRSRTPRRRANCSGCSGGSPRIETGPRCTWALRLENG